MFGIDMSLWNRVQYPSRKRVLLSVRDTCIVTVLVGICSFAVVASASKIVSMTVGTAF